MHRRPGEADDSVGDQQTSRDTQGTVLTSRRPDAPPEDGHKQLRVVPDEHYESWRLWAGNYSQFRGHRAEFVKLTRRILVSLDAIERAQRRSHEE